MKEHHRTASIFAGVYAAIQGVIWALFAIYCCAIYGCLVDFPLNLDQGHITSAYLLYVSYFRGECRIPNGLPLLTAPSAERTYYWMLIYGVVSACWLPTSVLLIVSAVNKIRGKSGVCFYIPWIINTAVIVIVDLVAFIIYAIDIKKTITVAEYEEFIENAVKVKGADGITVVPAAIMVAIFSRGILFWIINLILLGVVIQAAHSLTRRSPTEKFVQTGAKRDPVAERWKMADNNVVLSGLPRVNQKPPSPVMQRMSRSVENPISPQSPVNEEPPSPFVREPSLRRTLSASTVYDVYGRPTSEMLQDSPIFRRKPVQTLQDSPIFRRNQNESGGNLVNNQLPWSYISPQDLNTKKHELKTNKEPPKPPIPVPDYTVRHPPWTKGNLSRSNSALTPSTYKNLERQMAEKRAARHPY